MRPFDVLSRHTPIDRHYLLEASAGTGKTFSIEHLVLRLLLEESPLDLEQILVVTFTRAATQDLKHRIHQTLSNAHSALEKDKEPQEIPDFLKIFWEQGGRSQARRRLERALFGFDAAQIYTIHGFCSRMLSDHLLEGGCGSAALSLIETIPKQALLGVIRDALQTEIHRGKYSGEDLKTLSQEYGWDSDLFEDKLYHLITSGVSIQKPAQKHLFVQVAADCQRHLNRFLVEEEQFNYDGLLKSMVDALDEPLFCQRVRSRFKAAIIDEFQDTDPLQWKIFHTLFPPDDLSWGRLCLVGDPKQSIYAFRRADVYTYLAASQALGEENRAFLNTNYRSQPSLVKVLNSLFAKETVPGMIGLPRQKIALEYHPVSPSKTVLEKTFSDGKKAVHFALIKRRARPRGGFPIEEIESEYLFPFIGKEIHRLCTLDQIPYRSMALLVSDRWQGERVSQFLESQGIPTLKQRNESLIDSPWVEAVADWLRAVLYPRNESSLKKVLGGPLFRWSYQKICELDDPEKLGALLEQFMVFNPTLSDLLSCAPYDPSLRQLISSLSEYQAETHATPEELLQFLETIKERVDPEDPRFKKQFDPHQDAVSIITLHSSKGLEFDVVFPLGLLSRTPKPSQLIPIFDGAETSLHLIEEESDPRYLQHCEELDAEKARQLYVAMTRAKYRLYVFVALIEKGKPVPFGRASPMELYLARLGRSETDYTALYKRIEKEEGDCLISFLKKNKISYEELSESQMEPLISQKSLSTLPPPTPPKVVIPGGGTTLYSFTSLMKPKESHFEEIFPPHDYHNLEKSPHTLPAGSDTGNLLHLILEKIDFSLAQEGGEEVRKFIHPFLLQTPYESWEEVIVEIVMNALTAPLGNFSLADVSKQMQYREHEFLHPYSTTSGNGYLKGFIDLIFMQEGKYYILDWKSNWLGPDDSAYDREFLDQAMHSHDYYRQAEIYTEALRKYLRIVDPQFFETLFGGAYYLFLRGVHPHEKRGVLHIEPK